MSDPMTPDVREWMKRSDAEPPDAQYSARQVMTRLPEVRQHRRWWPFPVFYRKPRSTTTNDTTDYKPSPIPATDGHTPTVIGRTQSMLSPAKAITVGALVFAVGGVMLIAQPFQQQGSVPGAATDDPTLAPSFFSGTLGEGWTPFGTITTEERGDGVVLSSGEGYRGISFETSDPRMTGTAMMLKNEEDYRGGVLDDSPTGEAGVIRTGLIRIDNEDGSWSGTVTNLQLETPDWEIDSAWLTGNGAYDGLTAYIVIENLDDIHGYITPSGPPPAPEALPE